MYSHTAHAAARNPFAMLLEPEQVWQAVERSERLQRLHSRICRPLDRPLLPRQDADDFDALIDIADEPA